VTTTISTAEPTVAVTATTAPRCDPAAIDDVVVYVAMGDSGNFAADTRTGAILQYAEMLSDGFGVEVELRNYTRGGQHSSELLEPLRTDEDLRAELAEAEAVTLNIPIAVWVEPFQVATG
jgi:hypothetical protein